MVARPVDVESSPYHEWRLPDGSVLAHFFHVDDHYLIRFPEYADFTISADGKDCDCSPRPDVSKATVEHLYLNQVRPVALSLQGRLVFHGAAVVMADDVAIAALGASGRGKSTLAAAFAARGHAFLTDDALILEADGPGYRVLPSHPSVRLFDDSRAALLAAPAPVAEPVSYTSKHRMLASSELCHREEPCALRAAYVLGDGLVDEIRIERIAGAETVASWVGHSFLMDIKDKAVLARHFDKIADLARTVPAFRLDYPRRYDVFDDLIGRIAQHSQELSET